LIITSVYSHKTPLSWKVQLFSIAMYLPETNFRMRYVESSKKAGDWGKVPREPAFLRNDKVDRLKWISGERPVLE
jgi:hypothetical protein